MASTLTPAFAALRIKASVVRQSKRLGEGWSTLQEKSSRTQVMPPVRTRRKNAALRVGWNQTAAVASLTRPA